MTAETFESVKIRLAAERQRRADIMPTEQFALNAMHEAYTRLCELGFRDAIYCPKDGTVFDAISAGCTGIHDCHYHGDWPNGQWYSHADGDLYPSHPILFRLKPATSEDPK